MLRYLVQSALSRSLVINVQPGRLDLDGCLLSTVHFREIT